MEIDDGALATAMEHRLQGGFEWQLAQLTFPEWLRQLVLDFRDGKEIVCKAECNRRTECPLDLQGRAHSYPQSGQLCKIEEIACMI